MIFLEEYQNEFQEMSNDYFGHSYNAARSYDHNTYRWLMLNVNKAQRIVGRFGRGTYIAPFQKYRIDDCHFLADLIPHFSTSRIHKEEVSIINTGLTRALGYYYEGQQEYKNARSNPLKWFQYGIRSILGFPIHLTNWFGIISENTVDQITANKFFKATSGIIALISFISSIVGLISGWLPFISVMHKLLPKIF